MLSRSTIITVVLKATRAQLHGDSTAPPTADMHATEPHTCFTETPIQPYLQGLLSCIVSTSFIRFVESTFKTGVLLRTVPHVFDHNVRVIIKIG